MLPAWLNPRLIAPVGLIALIAALWAFGVTDWLSWANVAKYQSTLKTEVSAHPLIAPCLYVVGYAVSVTLSLPQAALLTIIGGLLFGALPGGALAVIGATIGAICLFLIARSAIGGPDDKSRGPALDKLRDELRRNGLSYLLAIRLVPIVPFWLVNLAAALCGMRLRPYVIATFFGMMPTTFVLASIGAGLSEVLARGEKPDLGLLFSLPVLGPLLALAALSVTPVIWRRWRMSNG